MILNNEYKIVRYESVTSTNDIAKKSDIQQAVFIANEQTAGKGSKGRSWQSDKNQGLYMSFLVRPTIEPAAIPSLTLMAAVVVCNAIEKVSDKTAKIKWPNDVLIGGKKVSGILTESVFGAGGIERVVCGIGINTSQSFSEELRDIAISLDIAKQQKELLCDEIIDGFFKSYEIYIEDGLSSFIDEFRQRSAISGNVSLITPNETIKGRIVEFDDTGAIVIETDGKKERFIAGEISLRGENGYV